MINNINELMEAVDTTALASRPLSDWRPILSKECQVYVFGETYLAKRFDQIHYKFCDKNEARDVVIDNIYALLRYKYFPKSTEENDDRIKKIVSSFTDNLKTTLQKVSFDENADCNVMKQLPDYCLAFRNGVYNFKDNKWFFKYDIINLKHISNKLYMYRDDYAIMWYFDYDFEPLPVSISDITLEDFVEIFKSITKEPKNKNYCFELLYNMSHDHNDRFNLERFTHLCEILGYTVLNSFSQHFVFFIGSGQNGKNSLFDGCFTNRVVPRPASNDLDAIENDRFITGALENKSHNIFLETSAKIYSESKMIKALTGSMYQTIESKGISKYSGVINCKYIFAGNDQDKIKFSDNTIGFRRRINLFEIFYKWDSHKRFMTQGDYYDTTFSDSLFELKSDIGNTTAYVYFAMFGIINATKNFTANFKFSNNEWTSKYADVDLELKEKIERVTLKTIISYMKLTEKNYKDCEYLFYDLGKNKLCQSKSLKLFGYDTYDKMIEMLNDEELSTAYFAENDVYISLRLLQNIIRDLTSPTTFTYNFKKLFLIKNFEPIYGNKPYVKCTFINQKLKILK